MKTYLAFSVFLRLLAFESAQTNLPSAFLEFVSLVFGISAAELDRIVKQRDSRSLLWA